MDETYALLMQGAMILLGLCLVVCLFRAFRGPKTADRVVAVNMAGTVTVLIILFLALLTREGFLLDVAMIYALLSFLAVMLLCRILIGVHRERYGKGAGRDG